MAVDRAPLLDRKFCAGVRALAGGPAVPALDLDAPIRAGSGLTARAAIELFDAQLASRHLDFAARALRARGEGFYTIGSSGHEGNAAVAAALRPSDPGFLHYRSGAFFAARARQVPGQVPLLDVLLGLCASTDDPIAGGRHKVFGSHALAIPPQTSTIASQLPKAVGAAVALDRATRLGIAAATPADAIIACTFGDASANHSTATGAINTAAWTAFQHLPVPILFVCEDNGIGISVRTPAGWIAASYGQRPGIHYVWGDGLDLPHAYDAAVAAVAHVRTTRRPAFLHLRTVRLLGHAGSDVEQSYRPVAEIEADEAADPVLATARLLVLSGARTVDQVMWQYEDVRARVAALADEAAGRPRLGSAAEVTATLAPRDPAAIAEEAARPAAADARAALWGDKLPEHDRPAHLAVHINRALGDLLAKYRELIVFGEDVARKGGVYNVTAELSRRAGVGHVFNTLLDEQSILGLAIGAGHLGLLPIPEIQYLAYLHNAEDQLRGEAASLQFFSSGQFRNPMVVRIAGYGYQKGFGGHFHNDNSVAVLRDIPGLVVASPARGDDAAAMLRTCVAAARTGGAVCVVLEPIALYMTRDLHEPGDGLWSSAYDPVGPAVAIGAARTYGAGGDLLIVSFANGLWMSLRVARRLERDHGIACRVLDLRWLAPLPADDVLREAEAVGRVLIVDETRRSGGVSEGVIAALVDRGFAGAIARVASEDSYIPLGAAANHVLVSEADIERAALALAGRRARRSAAP
ncbi:MAG TPA: thiamine pyrophosphate-dependent enzyme [Kofleriaceae bacterium]|nr:thiamine pyrophosphate-dependent enzyme [Kofleriaceae bacterium]